MAPTNAQTRLGQFDDNGQGFKGQVLNDGQAILV